MKVKFRKTANFFVEHGRKVWCYHIVLKDSGVFAKGDGRGSDSETAKWRMEPVLHANSSQVR